ncbi:hypothetical protein DWY69_06940 [Eisenbergiella massiliensis]|uniref:Uncharacterized protein n=2 Tax=Lachnospirales TaxID=3085636 RepID=A0A3E3J0D2_9FIRM|nr:hypothetical protein DWY69_06940 [Eisenbergiella massiliensis]DAN84775.1 MAG TPA: hypothetical protein [Caudoviricetes sp.]
MARQKKVTINGQDYTLQSVSPRWYFDANDRHGMTGGKKNTAGYVDEIFKNVVVEPPEIKAQGIEYFCDMDDGIEVTEQLLTEVESFLRGRK